MSPEAFATVVRAFLDRLTADARTRILLFGGKGGVGKTTIASVAALHLASRGPVILFSTDPASNLPDLFASGSPLPSLTVEPFHPDELWKTFLESNLERFVEIGDRGTYLDRDEIRRLLELAVPGVDELAGWMRIGELFEQNPESTIVVDTAPTGHTLRLLGSSAHFGQISIALEQMQAKHSALVTQLTRRSVHDEIDDFIESFRSEWERRTAALSDPSISAFIPLLLAEPWVIAQTARLIEEVRQAGLSVPFAVLNRSRCWCGCRSCAPLCENEQKAARSFSLPVIAAPESPFPLATSRELLQWIAGETLDSRLSTSPTGPESNPLALSSDSRLIFFAGKGGVGKTTVASSVALQIAGARPASRFIIISVDPAHALLDVFASERPPSNLTVETVDTRARWERFRERIGREIEQAVEGLTPSHFSLAHDSDVISSLLDMAPPGADEIFAISRLADLLDDSSIERVFVDTAPTGHFLRLLDLPRDAGEWVRELMRLLLRYKELVPPGALAEELLENSRSLRRIGEALTSGSSETVVITRAGEIVASETERLLAELEGRGMRVGGVVLNAFEQEDGCAISPSTRTFSPKVEIKVTIVPRASEPPATLGALRGLVPLE
ncbi:MAG: ArsA family ATPase [Thermoanaerobaculia bacterium]